MKTQKIDTMKTKLRIGNEMAVIETHSAIIEWQELLNHITVEPDDCPKTPWDNSDWYDHRLVRNLYHTRRGFNSFQGDELVNVIKMEFDTDLFDWYRKNGASKQVTRELVQASMRKRIEQLITWYRNGWEWWQVNGEMHGCYASVGGIDDYRYAQDMVEEIAFELAGELEALGYEVTGKPEAETSTNYRSQVNLFNWN